MYWPPRFSSSQPAIRTTSPGKCWPPTAVQPPDGSPGAHSCKSRRSIRYSRSCCFYAPQGHTKREYLMLTRSLGVNGPTSSAIGLGCMGMSDFYGPSDRAESIATMRMALDANVTLLDTGDFYGMGHNEMLIAEAIQGRPRDQIILSVKFGAQRDPGGKWVGFDARPAAVKTALAYTLKRLVPLHRGFDWLSVVHRRTGRCSGSTSISILRATPRCRRMNPARSSVSTIWWTEGGLTRKYCCMSASAGGRRCKRVYA